MHNWVNDTARLNFAAACLAGYPGTEVYLQQLAQFADYLEHGVAIQMAMYSQPIPTINRSAAAPAPQPAQTSQLRRGAPMRAQSMSQTPPPPPPMSELERVFGNLPNDNCRHDG